jgi:Uma2 family endonuclease
MVVNVQLPAPPVGAVPQHFVLTCVPWESFEKIADALSEHHVRLAYDRGTLELMSPQPIHEQYKTHFGRLLDVLAEELDIPVVAAGSTTFRKQAVERGVEPDECFYLGSAAKVQDWRTLNLDRDPPPDLAIEIENTTSCVDRMAIYAALGVREVWRFDGTTLQANQLSGEVYVLVSASPNLPYLPLEEIPPLIRQAVQVGDARAVLRAMRAWVRNRVVPLRQASQAPPAP